MARQDLLAYPYIQELVYREKIDPHQMNLMLRSIEESVLRAILRGAELTNDHRKLNLGVETAYTALAKHVGTLFSYSAIPGGTAFATAYDTVVVNDGGRQDKVAGLVTLDWDPQRKYSKIPRYDSDNDGIADTVAPSVTILVNGEPRDIEDDVYNCLNRRNDSFWVEQAATGSGNIEFQLPPSLNKNFNYIEVAPFPVFGVDITKIEYQDPRSIWNTIYEDNVDDYVFYNKAGPMVMHLAPKETNGTFRIHYDVLDGVNAQGFTNIDVGYVDYKDEVQTVYMKFENFIPATVNDTEYILQTSKLDFYINDNVDIRKFITEVSIVNSTDGTGDKVPINTINTDTYTFGNGSIRMDVGENLYLKIVMKENGITSPVFRGCQLTYTIS